MAYPSDLTDEEWDLIKDEVVFSNGYGNRRKHAHRHMMNAIFYIVTTGCQWRYLPSEFPPWKSVYSYLQYLSGMGILDRIQKKCVSLSRLNAGRKGPPTYSLIDNQSTKTTGAADQRGIDGGKKVKGRKRHIVTDTLGNLLHIKVHAANIHDTVAGCQVYAEALALYPSLKGVCADAGYRKTFVHFVQDMLERTVEISQRISPGWAVLAKRWVVERTFGWLNNFRRLTKDFESLVSVSENFVKLAHTRLLLKRLTLATTNWRPKPKNVSLHQD